jgi:hypothetical protein
MAFYMPPLMLSALTAASLDNGLHHGLFHTFSPRSLHPFVWGGGVCAGGCTGGGGCHPLSNTDNNHFGGLN